MGFLYLELLFLGGFVFGAFISWGFVFGVFIHGASVRGSFELGASVRAPYNTIESIDIAKNKRTRTQGRPVSENLFCKIVCLPTNRNYYQNISYAR